MQKLFTQQQLLYVYEKSCANILLPTDKVVPDQKAQAHARFQEIAFAYAVLSSPQRRARYDATGSTTDSIHLDENDDFNWLDFFRSQYREHVTSEKIDNFKAKYQGSEEEKRDVLVAYTAHKGSMLKVFNAIMLSNPLEDEPRFRAYIDAAIAEGRVEPQKAYNKETAKSKNARKQAANREAKLAEEHARLLGLKVEDIKEVGKKGAAAKTMSADLAALIGERQKGRAEGFLEGLEAKYGKNNEKEGKKGKKRKAEEEGMPDEEAFQAAAKRLKKGKKEGKLDVQEKEVSTGKLNGAKKARAETPSEVDEEEDEGESLDSDSPDERYEDVEDDEEEEENKPSDASEDEEPKIDKDAENPQLTPSPSNPAPTSFPSVNNSNNPKINKSSSSVRPPLNPYQKKYADRERKRAKKEAKAEEKERMKQTLRGLGALEESGKEKKKKKGPKAALK